MKLLYTLLIILATIKLNAQCPEEFDNSINICASNLSLDTLWFNHNLDESIYDETYQFSWSLKEPEIGFFGEKYYVNSILSDSTLFRPYFKGFSVQDSLLFFLDIYQNDIHQCQDSIWVTFSGYTYLTAEGIRYIKIGDTVQIGPLQGGGIGELSYSWTPTTGMIDDSTECCPRVSPDSFILYSLEIIDSKGCRSSGDYTIYVDPVSINELEVPIVNVYPNPSTSIINLEGDFYNKQIDIYSVNGERIESKVLLNSELDISRFHLGVYHFIISDKGKPIYKGKFIKQ